jgi:hypothetical protein
MHSPETLYLDLLPSVPKSITMLSPFVGGHLMQRKMIGFVEVEVREAELRDLWSSCWASDLSDLRKMILAEEAVFQALIGFVRCPIQIA